MPQRPPLAKSEIEVARIVWDLGQATVRQVLQALPKDRGLEFKTVQTYLRRLKAKGYVRTRREGRNDIYIPCVRSNKVVRQVVQDFLNLVFDGDTTLLFQHLIHNQGLTDEEIEQLQRTLKQRRRRKR